ncbi:MAG TPA: hypothetical protein VFC47_11425 [Caulobacteraceae bacterium]|nr:hypothetical protein [Caulobacteraceae bacterium]
MSKVMEADRPETAAEQPKGEPGTPVIVRTQSAGVHFGYLFKHRGKEVELVRSRRIWRWYGANTLSEIATAGLDVARSRVAAPVSIILTEVIEIISCTPEAVAKIEAAKWAS